MKISLIATMSVLSLCAAAWVPAMADTPAAGPVSKKPEVLVGPFDLHRKYRSMEGPYVKQVVRIGDLISTGKVIVPESDVIFVEGKDGAPGMAAPMSAGDGGASASKPAASLGKKRELYWFKGIKLVVLDENDKPMPSAEFICHLNIDVDMRQRNAIFPNCDRPGNARVMTLTQGQTEFYLPEGLGLPVASDEDWTFIFQAANRTTDKHRRIKHLCTLEFIKDSDVPKDKPLKALTWFNPYIAVAVSGMEEKSTHHGPDCSMPTPGESAPNMVPGSTVKDSGGLELSGHWAVPKGRHEYESPITEQLNRGFAARDRRIHAVWTHVHPLCRESSLQLCTGDQRKTIFKANSTTRTTNGLELERIDTVLSREGITMPGGGKYVLHSIYENPTEETHDSMVAMGIFCADDLFVKPDFDKQAADISSFPRLELTLGKEGVFCGIKEDGSATCTAPVADYAGTDRHAIFDQTKDGALLKSERRLEIETSAGPLHIALDPSIAPKHATQVYRLMQAGAYNGTTIYRYESGFVLQVSNAESKAPGLAAMPASVDALLRRLPLETVAGASGLHKKWVLSMARYGPTDSAVSSFSILLGDAPHLDRQYTVFGRVIPDSASLSTIKKITDEWEKKHPHILGVKDLPAQSASSVKP